MELFASNVDSLLIGGVDNENHRGGVGVVASPVGPDRRLAAQVPDVQRQVFVLQRLHVEANGGFCGHHFAHLQTVQNRCFPGTIQAQDENADFLLHPPELGEDVGEAESLAHGGFQRRMLGFY